MALAAQRISYYVSLSGVIMQFHIIILDELQPSPLSEIQLLLCENILQTLMIRVYITTVSNKKMSPGLSVRALRLLTPNHGWHNSTHAVEAVVRHMKQLFRPA